MADLALLTGATGIEPLWPEENETSIISGLAAETVANGNTAYLTTSGTYGLADANASGKHQFRGLFLQAAGAGQASSILRRGGVMGFDLSNLAYDALVYVSDTAGALADAAGSATIVAGRVLALSDKDKTKYLWVSDAITTNWP